MSSQRRSRESPTPDVEIIQYSSTAPRAASAITRVFHVYVCIQGSNTIAGWRIQFDSLVPPNGIYDRRRSVPSRRPVRIIVAVIVVVVAVTAADGCTRITCIVLHCIHVACAYALPLAFLKYATTAACLAGGGIVHSTTKLGRSLYSGHKSILRTPLRTRPINKYIVHVIPCNRNHRRLCM